MRPLPTKDDVRDFWNEESCGEVLLLPSQDLAGFEAQARERYRLEPYIEEFALFDATNGKRVLEIGVGLGADHQRFAEAGAELSGIDLTTRAVEHTCKRLSAYGLSSDVQVGDAENLRFSDDAFDVVYSWGVIHHSPDTPRAAREILRVLKPGGRFSVMIYQRRSLVGAMLWARYGLFAGKPFVGLDAVYSRFLESPGTKAYSPTEAKALFAGASTVRTRSVLTHGDLLESGAGQRHQGYLLMMARKVWPRSLIKRFLPSWGLFLLVEGIK
jgi:SAM-dependent methyltransferase